jgi:GTP-binding protein HflX
VHETFRPQLIENAVLVGMRHHGSHDDLDQSMEELEFLAVSAGANVVGRVVQRRGQPRASHLIGKGKLEEVAQTLKDHNGNLVIFDDDLSPMQVRNLETAFDTKVIDRSILILDIFARRAKSNEAKTQVELAQMKYLFPRLTGLWTHFSKQFGGIGTKGPGETQLEVDRRLVEKRIQRLTAGLKRIDRERTEQRKGRKEMFKISLVGYTNAGKSTLFNLLTKSQVFADDRLFSTLDATTRVLFLPGAGRVLLTDTIGFIRKLPPALVASFRATLSEIRDADLLLHVVDYAREDIRRPWKEVEKTLIQIGSSSIDRLAVLNKIDLLNGDQSPSIQNLGEGIDYVAVSAIKKIGIAALLDRLGNYYRRHTARFKPPDGDIFDPLPDRP